jgi:DNA-binding GntR family transcriptional regulator
MALIKRPGHLYDQAYEILLDQILAGTIRPGQRLKDADLAAQLKISRTPVREAMRMLEQDGVLVALERGGYEVTDARAADLMGLYRCRAALEELAAQEATERMTREHQNTLEALISRTDGYLKIGLLEKALKSNTDFHTIIVELSGNRYLVKLIDSLRRLILLHRSSLLNAVAADRKEEYVTHLRDTQEQHRAIFDAIIRGEAAEAGQLMKHHLLETAKEMESMFRGLDAPEAR